MRCDLQKRCAPLPSAPQQQPDFARCESGLAARCCRSARGTEGGLPAKGRRIFRIFRMTRAQTQTSIAGAAEARARCAGGASHARGDAPGVAKLARHGRCQHHGGGAALHLRPSFGTHGMTQPHAWCCPPSCDKQNASECSDRGLQDSQEVDRGRMRVPLATAAAASTDPEQKMGVSMTTSMI